MYRFIKPILFLFDPETIHHLVFFFFARIPRICRLFAGGIKRDKRYQVVGHNMSWDFPVGIAAGLDKNATAFNFFWRLGFGSIEVGTVTPRAQAGNEKPRVFRLIPQESLRNFMGFPNEGAQKILPRVLGKKDEFLGVNIGKNSDTDKEFVGKDYLFLYQCFKSCVDYIVINISCPNVKNLGALQERGELEALLDALEGHRSDIPLFIKIGPDQSEQQLDQIIDVAKKYKLAGIVATNTYTDEELGRGGISGKLLYERAKKVRNYLLDKVGRDLDIIGVGGFSCFEDVWEFLSRGGRFIQIYSSFIFKGVPLLKEVQRGLDKKMKEAQVKSVMELIK